MTAYTSIFNTPPSGTNYLIGDTVTLTGGDVWKYAGNGQWAADQSGSVKVTVDLLTGGIDLLGGGGYAKKDLGRSRKQMPVLLIVGDSLTFANTLDLATTSQYVDNGYATWAIGLKGYHPKKIINAGIGGEHAYHVAARIDAVLSAAGPVDDIIVMVGSNHQDNTAAQISYCDSVLYIVAACRKTGANLTLLHNPGFNTDTATLTSIRRTEGAWLKETFGSMGGVAVVDMYPLVMDTSTGDWKANYTYDGSHPSSLGGYFMGKDINLPYCPVLASFVGEPGLLNTNPLFAGTSGTNGAGCSGTIATGWSGLCSNATAVHSQAAEANGLGNEQIVTITASAAGYYMLYAANLNIVSGLDIAASAVIAVESPVNVENVHIKAAHSGPNSALWNGKSGNTTYAFTEAFVVKPITRIMRTSADTVAGQLTIRIDFKGAGSAVLRVSRAGLFDIGQI